VIRRSHQQLALAQVILFGVIARPEELMDPQLRRIDTLLEDEVLLDEVLAVLRGRRPQSARRGRPGTPAEVVLRMLVLKHLRDWSFERLEWEVKGNLVYRRFCRIDAQVVPDAKTLVRLAKLIDGKALRALYQRTTTMAIERGVAVGRKSRIDTTVVEAPIRHPTDSRLLEDSVRVLGRHLRRIANAGVELARPLRNTALSVRRRAQEIAQIVKQRGEEAKEALKKPYRKLIRITGQWVKHAQDAIVRAQRSIPSLDQRAQGEVARSLEMLQTAVARARQVIRQTRARVLRGVTNSADKLISIFEPHAQILRRGKPHQPTEFGLLVSVQEAEHGLITDISEVPGKADAPLLVPSVERHLELFGRAPEVVTTDRGFYSTEGEEKIKELGVRNAALPKPGYRSKERIAHERKRSFKRARAWRAGGEARISHLKHDFGMKRSRYKGPTGIHRTIHWAALSNNLCATARHEKS
jgi:transposase, IS5 family